MRVLTKSPGPGGLGWVALALVNLAAWLGLGASLWSLGLSNDDGCEVYCGPAPNLMVSMGISAVGVSLWLLAVVFDALVIITGRPARGCGLIAAGSQAVPIVILVGMALLSG